MHASFLVDRYLHRPKEEVYDLQQDPWELDNRVDDPAITAKKHSLAQSLMRWMHQQGDNGIETEMRATDRQSR
ncbi:MAG: hypothetical protein K9N51_13875 [Candidatus Pacebacteria bacterium]|nr:hypothetical protein [Candidatus Paceibacterota bacterium]